MKSLVYLLTFVLLAAAIFFEALHAPAIDDAVVPHLDKIAHAAAFGLPARPWYAWLV